MFSRCTNGYEGEFCTIQSASQSDDDDYDTITIVAVVIAGLLVILVVFAVCIMYKTRTSKPRDEPTR